MCPVTGTPSSGSPSTVASRIVLLFIGTDIKGGEEVAPGRTVTVKVGGAVKKYRRLEVGDTVEEGQLLARVDDRLARDALAIKQAAVEAAEAHRRNAAKTRDEAKKRFDATTQSTRLARAPDRGKDVSCHGP